MKNNSAEDVTEKLENYFSISFANKLSIQHSRISDLEVKYVKNQSSFTQNDIMEQILMAEGSLLGEGFWNIPDLITEEELDSLTNEILLYNHIHILEVSLTLNNTEYVVANKASVDNIVASCADMIGTGSLILPINGSQVKVVSMSETMLTDKSELQEWCR